MSVGIDIEYQGDLHTRAVHGPSGSAFITDAPTDNGGKGEAFSPTDLVGTALGTCILTIMGLVAERNGLDIRGTTAHVEKSMAARPLRRIARLEVTIRVPAETAARLSEADRDKLERAAETCPVHASLHPDVVQDIRFEYAIAATA